MSTTLDVNLEACVEDGHLDVVIDRTAYRQALRPGPGRVRCRACGTFRPEAPRAELSELLGVEVVAVRRAAVTDPPPASR